MYQRALQNNGNGKFLTVNQPGNVLAFPETLTSLPLGVILART